jgi:L-aminopeptidase/D-esterase-like protein
MRNETITAIDGIRVGQSISKKNHTGCTVLLLPHPSVTAVDARGGWPGTIDTDSVRAGKTFYRKHAIFLTGGDVYGLKCAFGIQRFLLDNRLASKYDPPNLPGVVGANIYDLEFGKSLDRVDYEKLGYEACLNSSSAAVTEGNQGAGLGATVGKLKGIHHSMKGGVGSSVTSIADRVKVGALVVTNAVGNIFGMDGTTLAGTRKDRTNGEFLDIEDIAEDYLTLKTMRRHSSRATTIGVIATDLELSHESAIKVAEMAHDGLARCIRPVHATTDGDTLFCVSTGKVKTTKTSVDLITLIGHLASNQVQKSVLNAIARAEPLAGIPASGSFGKSRYRDE